MAIHPEISPDNAANPAAAPTMNVVKERLSNLSDTDDSGSVSLSGSSSLSSDKSAAIGIPGHSASSSPSPTIQSQSSLDSGHGSLPEAASHMAPPTSPTGPAAGKKAGIFSRLKKVSLGTGPNAALDVFNFEGDGVVFKGKLVGIADVEGARGDDMCQRAMLELNKALKLSKEHKARIIVSVAMSGLKIKDEKDATVLHHHPVPKISYIWRDQSDARSFGYICGTPDVGHKFYALKADKSADAVVGAIHRLFQLAFKMKQHEIDQHRKTHAGNSTGEPMPTANDAATGGAGSVLQTEEVNLLDLESELQVLSQGIQHMQTMQSQAGTAAGDAAWVADFGSEAWPSQAPPPAATAVEAEMSSASSTSSSQSDPWGRGGTPQSQRTITPDPFDTVGAMAASLAADPFAAPLPALVERSVPTAAVFTPAPWSHQSIPSPGTCIPIYWPVFP
ncbi:protein disabled-like isoform X2 [Paramacrobiotus metropolitanus]|uniref:protein disabled-like isoform X2 n=1 Tax=Paramacrobiotus metropolitanus TaxID=2943436 RepID=UPI00244648D4|nr:protein disabled-like isoform X2 [Paramacrobiotus metropolitanus]